MKPHLLFVAFATVAVTACSPAAQMPDAAEPALEPAAVRTVAYAASTEDFANPDRGQVIVYNPTPTADGNTDNREPLATQGVKDYFQRFGAENNTRLARVVYTLGAWRESDIPQGFLDRLTGDFATARQIGFRLIPYFAYNWPTTEQGVVDAPKDRIKRHLEQLRPVLAANADVISFVYTGFIGAWGEWHDSSYGNVNPDITVNANTREILDAILAAVPRERAVTLRYVGHKQQIYGPAALAASAGFAGSAPARIGFNDECYMSDYHPDVKALRLANRPYLQQEGLYLPQIALMDTGCFEFNPQSPKVVSCADLLEELSVTRIDILEMQNALDRVQGDCVPEVYRRLGYRFELKDSTMTDAVRAGTSLTARFNVTNVGFSPPFNARKLELILRHKASGKLYRYGSTNDPRRWAPAQTRQVEITGVVPSSALKGDYDVLLNLPDPAPSVYGRPEYAIRLANDGVWEAATGFNSLKRTVRVN